MAFYESFKSKREQVEEEIAKLKSSLQALSQLSKSLQIEEAVYFEKNRGGPNFQAAQLVDIYNRQRRNKSKIELLKEHLTILEAAKKKFAGEEAAMKDWDNMFKRLNIDTETKRMAQRISQESTESQSDRKLNDIKRGFNLLVTPAYPKRTFEPFENKYNIQELLDLKAQHSQSVRFKQLAAKSRVENRLNPKLRIGMGSLTSGEYSVKSMSVMGNQTDRSTKSRIQSSKPDKQQLTQTQKPPAQEPPKPQPAAGPQQGQQPAPKPAPVQPAAPPKQTTAPAPKPTAEPLPPNEF